METQPKRLRFIYRWVLKGRLDYYGNLLEPGERSFLTRFFFKRFGLARIPEPTRNHLLELKQKGNLVFALKHRSRLDFILLHYLFLESGLPLLTVSAELGSWIFFSLRKLVNYFFTWLIARLNFWGQYQEEYWQEVKKRIERGESMLTYLIYPPRFTTRYLHPEQDPLYNLILWQEESEKNLIVVPLVIIYSKAPEREERGLVDILFGKVNEPGVLRRIYNYVYLSLTEGAIVEVADPVNIREFMERKDQQGLNRQLLTHRLREHLLGHLEREKKVILGPRLKSRSQIMTEVLQDEILNQELEQIARDEERKLIEVKRDAARYLDEIAANYNQRMVDFLDLVLTWAWRNLYNGIEVDESGFEKIREIAKRYPVVYIPSHKSHIDYLILSYVLYHRNFFVPHIVAGINLNFFPVGAIFRGAGAFFMRRKFRGNRVYVSVFRTYLKILIREGYPLELFMEGGRSRSGRLLLPKLGVVKYMVEGYGQLGLKDLYFVPVYIGYDQVMEQGEYLRELKGGKKTGESFLALLRARHLIRERYGKIYLNFGKPISLQRYLEEIAQTESKESEERYEKLGYQLVNEINRLTVVTPGNLVALGLLASAKPARKLEELKNCWGWLYQYLIEKEVRLAKSFENNRDWYEEALQFYQAKKMIEFILDEESVGQIISIAQENRLKLEFYKNNIIHFFLPSSLTALLWLNFKSSKEIIVNYKALKQMLKFDFLWPEIGNEEMEVKTALKFLEREKEAKAELAKNFAGPCANFLESYLIVLRTWLAFSEKETSEQEFLARALRMGEQYLKLGEIERVESISRINFQGALRWLEDENWLSQQAGRLIINSEAKPQITEKLNWLSSLLSGITRF